MSKEALRWLAVSALVFIVSLALVYAASWLFTGLDTVSPERIRRMSRQANAEWEALRSKEASISALDRRMDEMERTYGEDRRSWPQGKSDEYLQLVQQRENLRISYNTDCGDYNAMWQDEWQAIPAPGDLPTRCELKD